MKRIGIATIHKSSNFGGSLQAYALYKYLESQGHSVEIIDLLRPVHDRFIYDSRYKPYRSTRFTLKNRLLEFAKQLLGYKDNKGYSSEVSKQKFAEFFKDIKYSKEYRKVRYIYKDAPQYDVYVSGSDQLWNPMHSFSIEPFFLTFAPEGCKKISYATSIGVTKLTDREKTDFKRWLASYEAISVREDEGKQLLGSFIKDKNIEVVADPTFLLDIKDWKKLAITPSMKENYILLFSLSNAKPLVDFAIRMSKESGKRLVIIKGPSLDANSPDYILDNNIGPREFLGYFDNADIVITDSFHGSVFSMLMGAKNFFSYIQPVSKTGNRITNLLKTVEEPNHLLPSDLAKSYKELDEEKIDKVALYDRIAKVREHAREFLTRNI
ncbi:MAG: polysaccharide pyruvyl transferase family protein [Bacteroidaceae bacterium]|nr:polysaccharide pyruvyl transferase family protein [Bacteroidaceae bacterium]